MANWKRATIHISGETINQIKFLEEKGIKINKTQLLKESVELLFKKEKGE